MISKNKKQNNKNTNKKQNNKNNSKKKMKGSGIRTVKIDRTNVVLGDSNTVELIMKEEDFEKPFTKTIHCGNIRVCEEKLITVVVGDLFFQKYNASKYYWEMIDEPSHNDFKVTGKSKSVNIKNSMEFRPNGKTFTISIEPRGLNDRNEMELTIQLLPDDSKVTVKYEVYLKFLFTCKANGLVIDKDQLKIVNEKPIGNGGEAEIFDAMYRKRECVVRKMKEVGSGKHLPEILKHLRHENIIEFYGYFIDESDCMNLVLEKAITSFEKCYNTYDVPTNCSILIDAIKGIKYMHSKDFVHLDIKPDNILVFQTEKGLVGKINDFGTTKTTLEGFNYQSGTALYIDPECIRNKKYSYKSDIFSFGRTIEVVLGRYSEDKMNKIGRILMKNQKQMNDKAVLAYQPETKHPMKRVNDLIERCCVHDPKQRTITYDEIIRELEAIKQLSTVNKEDTITYKGYHIFKGECSIEKSFKEILDDFNQSEISNGKNRMIIDNEVEFRLKMNRMKQLQQEINDDSTDATNKVTKQFAEIQSTKKTIEEIFKEIEKEQNQSRKGTQEYDIAMEWFDEKDEVSLQLKEEMMKKAAKKGNVKAILFVRDLLQQLYDKLQKKQIVEELQFKKDFNTFLDKMKEKNELMQNIQPFEINENSTQITECEAFEFIDILSTVSISAKIEKARWLIHGKGTATNYYEARKILKSIDSTHCQSKKNNQINELKSILEFTQFVDNTEITDLKTKCENETNALKANKFIFLLEKTNRNYLDVQTKSTFDKLLEIPQCKLNALIYEMKTSRKYAALYNIIKMAESNQINAIEYIVEWLSLPSNSNDLNESNRKLILMIRNHFILFHQLSEDERNQLTLQQMKLYYSIKGVLLGSKYCIEQITKTMLQHSEKSKEIVKVSQRMILPDAKSGRKEALYLVTKCHLELKEPQCALKYTTKSMDNLDERTISIGAEIINSLLLLNDETFERMRSIQRQYLAKISLINEEVGRDIKKKSHEIFLNQAKKILKNILGELRNEYFNNENIHVSNAFNSLNDSNEVTEINESDVVIEINELEERDENTNENELNKNNENDENELNEEEKLEKKQLEDYFKCYIKHKSNIDQIDCNELESIEKYAKDELKNTRYSNDLYERTFGVLLIILLENAFESEPPNCNYLITFASIIKIRDMKRRNDAAFNKQHKHQTKEEKAKDKIEREKDKQILQMAGNALRIGDKLGNKIAHQRGEELDNYCHETKQNITQTGSFSQ